MNSNSTAKVQKNSIQTRDRVKKRQKWTPEKNKQLSELYNKYSNKEIAKIMGTSLYAIKKQASRLRLKKTVKYMFTDEEIEEIRRNYKLTPVYKLAEKYGISQRALWYIAKKYEINKRNITINYPWTPEKNKQLSELYNKYSNKEIAKIMGISTKTVCEHGNKLGLSKSKEIKKKRLREIAIERNYSERIFQCDKTIAYYLAGNKKFDKEKKNALIEGYLKYPELIELKRKQILLKRKIKELKNG